VDGFTISGLPVVSGSYVGTNPIWGDMGSPNAQDWYQIDLGVPATFSNVKLYFYSNKQFGSGGNTYREPSVYTIQYYDGTNWVDAPGQLRSPGKPAPNYNEVYFRPVTRDLGDLLPCEGAEGTGADDAPARIWRRAQGGADLRHEPPRDRLLGEQERPGDHQRWQLITDRCVRFRVLAQAVQPVQGSQRHRELWPGRCLRRQRYEQRGVRRGRLQRDAEGTDAGRWR
jgi:NedA-like, galactose-binding domain